MEPLTKFIEKIVLENLNKSTSKNNYNNLRVRNRLLNKNKLLLKLLNARRTIPKVRNYLNTIKKFSDENFYDHFRMSKSIFSKLKEELQPLWTNAKTGRACTNLEECLYITLWTLANKNSYRKIGDRFNKSISSVFKIVVKTCRSIVKLLTKVVIWPASNEEIDSIVAKFNYLRGANSFPNVVGSIGCMHLKILNLKEDRSSYYNRKGYNSMILQATCDSDGVFTNVFFGWPGRSHDANVFKESELGKRLEKGTLKLLPDIHLIGHSVYPLSTYFLEPYRDNDNLSEPQKRFNYLLSSSRVIIE